MIRAISLMACRALAAPAAQAQQDAPRCAVTQAMTEHVLPGCDWLAAETAGLAAVARDACAATVQSLRAAFHDAFGRRWASAILPWHRQGL